METLKTNQKNTRTALLINLTSASIIGIEIGSDLNDIALALDCSDVEAVDNLKNSDILYVDTKALTNDKNGCSFVYNSKEYFGDGILVGSTNTGVVSDVITNEEELEITFYNR